MKGRLIGHDDANKLSTSYDDISGEGAPKGLAQVYEVYDRKTGVQYVVADGHPDFA